MARGVKPKKDRKSVRSTTIPVRLNDYELETLFVCLDINKDPRPISTFVRDLILEKCSDMLKDIDKPS